jgi:hypothetical protein
MTPLKQCPGCGHAALSATWRISRQPVVLNYRFATAGAAMRVKRRDLRLAQCLSCGLVFNVALDSEAIPYDGNYENRQCHSSTFQKHLHALADGLIEKYGLRGGRILEIGCGKGDFLKLLCARAKASGDGYDTSYEPAGARQPGVRFHRRYAGPREIRTRYDAVICRHVVEHVGPIALFLGELRAMAAAAGDPVILIETPAFEWIARHGCFWDFFYEHCNYFTKPCLAHLCELAGFSVIRQRPVFGGQYQLLELRVRRNQQPMKSQPPGASVCLATFACRAEIPLQRMKKQLRRHGAARGWAIWGAGAKGVALVNRLRELPPRFVIDTNAAKQGCFIPGSRVPVIAPGDPRVLELALVLIANPNYAAEITLALRQSGFASTILTA